MDGTDGDTPDELIPILLSYGTIKLCYHAPSLWGFLAYRGMAPDGLYDVRQAEEQIAPDAERAHHDLVRRHVGWSLWQAPPKVFFDQGHVELPAKRTEAIDYAAYCALSLFPIAMSQLWLTGVGSVTPAQLEQMGAYLSGRGPRPRVP
jgi:hypothetical protein